VAGANSMASAAAAACSVCMGLGVYASPRAMGETWCVAPLVWGLSWAVSSSRRTQFMGGLLLSVAVGLRLQAGFFCVGALLWAWRCHRVAPWALLISLLVGAALFGVVDAVTWGRPFHSALTYLQFNLVDGRASEYGTAPWWFYGKHLVLSEGLTVVPAAVLVLLRRSWPGMLGLSFMVLHCAIPHKELRFVYPALPLLFAGAAVALSSRPQRVAFACAATGLLSLASLPWLTFYRLGVPDMPAGASAFDFGGAENRLLKVAGQRADVCGLRIDSMAHWRTAGYTAFHGTAPLYRVERAEESIGHFNYLIGLKGSVAGEVVAADGEVVLVKQGEVCVPDPAYRFELE
jgi:GPI mannosyltransferase 3